MKAKLVFKIPKLIGQDVSWENLHSYGVFQLLLEVICNLILAFLSADDNMRQIVLQVKVPDISHYTPLLELDHMTHIFDCPFSALR